MSMRPTVLVAALFTACAVAGDQPRTVASDATAGPATALAATAAPLAHAELDCTVTWAEHYRSLQAMFDRADVVARGTVVARAATLLYAYDASGRSPRDARLTSLRVSETFKGAPVGQLNVIEDVCPGLTGGDEWIVFGARADPRFGPDTPGEHYFTIGGPQGQFRLAAGRVSGPYFKFQRVVRTYADTPAADLAGLLRALRAADADARALFTRHGWTVVRTAGVNEIALPSDYSAPAGTLCGQAPVARCAELSALAGLDLRAAAGRDARVLRLVLEFETPIGGGAYPPSGYAVVVGHDVVGAWVLSAVTRDLYAVTDRANVPIDR